MNFEKIESARLGEVLYKGEHESGLKVYVIPKKFKKSYASFATKYGSVDSEFEGVVVPDGIAHFLEHKLFEKEDGSDAFADYAKTGASANAYTSFNLTAYLFSSTDRFYENLDILFETVTRPHFTPENVQKEQGIIGQEIRMYDDNPDWRVFFNFLDALYYNHPVKKDIAGTVDTIAEIDSEILYKCYGTFYHPSNMAFFAAGDVDLDKISAKVDKWVVGAKKPEIDRIYPEEPAGVRLAIAEQKLSVAAPIFLMGFKDADVGYDGKVLLKKEIVTVLALEMLFSRSGKLYRDLYEQGLINDTFGQDYTAEKDYAFSTFGGESPDPIRVRDIVMDAINNFELTEKALETAKGVVIGKFLRMFNGIERMGNNFIANVFKDINVFDYPEICDEVQLSEVANRINKHFTKENMAISIIYPY